MSHAKPRTQSFYTKNKLAIETVALIAILVTPVFLYLAAEARVEIVVSILLGCMSVLMLAMLRLT
jgi:predicted membrane channel-forming protein YqfA (hemolysin III family)